jgi:hypothetical protein
MEIGTGAKRRISRPSLKKRRMSGESLWILSDNSVRFSNQESPSSGTNARRSYVPKPINNSIRRNSPKAPSDDEMMRAARDLIAGKGDRGARTAFLAAITQYLASEMAPPGKRSDGFSGALFRAARNAAPTQPPNRRARTLGVVKGEAAPLSESQRELVAVFVEHLRSLPAIREDSNRVPDSHWVVNSLLSAHYAAKFPDWKPRLGERSLNIGDLPEAAAERIERLLKGAANPEDPALKRRRERAEVEEMKKMATEAVEYYRHERERLGFEPDPAFACAVVTPLERAAESTWPEVR